jgi:hypothetical protein
MKTFLEFIQEAKLPIVELPENDIDASEFDAEDIREHYITGEIFKEGSLVEQISTGTIGTIMRRGTNYLICLTDEGTLFKPWITDSKELE